MLCAVLANLSKFDRMELTYYHGRPSLTQEYPMSRFCLVALLIVALSLCTSAASPPADQIFPETTKGFFAIRSLDEFTKQWEKTQFGQLMNDPLMDDFKKEVQKNLTERMENTFGLTLDGISSLPSGEIALGMIAVPGQIPGYVLTMDVAEKRPETNEYLTNLTQKLVSAGVQRTTETYRGQQMTILTFPPPETPVILRGARGNVAIEPIERRAYYMFWQDVLIASDRLHLLQLIADRFAGQSRARSLAAVEAYQVVMNRCIGDMPEGTQPIVRWYVEPLDYGESVRVTIQNRSPAAQNRQSRPSIFAILKQQGFDAIRGIGGVVSMHTEAQETVYRTFIYTQKPYRLAMRMLNFPDSTHFTLPTWMPGDLARYTTFYVDPLVIFDHFGGLFDAIVMPGEVGVWGDILDGLERDPHGPRINLREELLVHLGNRALGMSRYEKPITINSESIVVAVELKPGQEPAMIAGVEKLFHNDPEMQATQHRSYKIWHRRPIEDIRVMGADGVSGVETSSSPMFPEGSVVVARGNLFVSTDKEYLKVILDRLDTEIETSISDEAEHKTVSQIFAHMGLADKPHFFRFFARTHETLRPTYEMIRQDQVAQSQILLAKLLNEFLLPEEEPGVRRQIVDGSTLPEFDKVQHYFGTVGIYGTTEDNGYFIKGFTLEREE